MDQRENAEMVKSIEEHELIGFWQMTPSIFNERVVKKNKTAYWELSKVKRSIWLKSDRSIKLLNEEGEEVDSGSWKFHPYPSEEAFSESIALIFNLEEDTLISGKYFMTSRNDSLFIFKNIWSEPDSSDYVKFTKVK